MTLYDNSGKYLFRSQRLGFRLWKPEDLGPLHAMCSDSEVMRYFPKVYSLEESQQFIKRMQSLYSDHGHCFYATDRLDTGSFIGFIGFSRQTFLADFTPCVDIGWRLDKAHWNQGFASEGAKRCLEYARRKLPLTEVYSMAPSINLPSISVMQKIGMKRIGHFLHPELEGHPTLEKLDLYKIFLT
jgi:RimJ/RimL family protein N-acetyltransferase